MRPIDADALLNETEYDSNFRLIIPADKVKTAPTLTPPNEPLTLEQLREMDGEPVYIPETSCWVLVTQNPFVTMFTWPDGEQCSAYDWYEQVGPVYRRPPEGEEDT